MRACEWLQEVVHLMARHEPATECEVVEEPAVRLLESRTRLANFGELKKIKSSCGLRSAAVSRGAGVVLACSARHHRIDGLLAIGWGMWGMGHIPVCSIYVVEGLLSKSESLFF